MESLTDLGIRFGLTDDQLRELLGPLAFHDLTQTRQVSGTSSAGVFEATLKDSPLSPKDLPDVLRKGTVSGRVEGFLGIMFSANGEFVLRRKEGYDTLSFQLVNSAIARLDAQFTLLHSDPSQAYFSFSVSTGILAAAFGVPETDTVVQVPIRLEPSGVMHFHFSDDDVTKLVEDTEKALKDKSELDQSALRRALRLSAPISLFAYEDVSELHPSITATRFSIAQLLERAYSRCNPKLFPEFDLSFSQEAGRESKQSARIIATPAKSVYFAIEDQTIDEKATFLARYQTVQELVAKKGIFTMTLAEMRKYLLPLEED